MNDLSSFLFKGVFLLQKARKLEIQNDKSIALETE